MQQERQHLALLAGMVLAIGGLAMILGDFLLADWQSLWPYHLLVLLLQTLLLGLLYRHFSQRCLIQISDASTQKELDSIQEQAEKVLESLGDGIAIVDRNYKVLYQNTLHRQMAGGFHGDQFCYRAFAHQTDICPNCPVQKTLADGQVHRLSKIQPEGRTPGKIEIVASPLKNERGEVIAGIETVRALTS